MKLAILALLAALLQCSSAYVLPIAPHAAPVASRCLGTPRARWPQAQSPPEPEHSVTPTSNDADAADVEAAEAAAAEDGGGLDVIDSLTLLFGVFLALNFLGVPLPFSQSGVP